MMRIIISKDKYAGDVLGLRRQRARSGADITQL